MKKIFAIVYMLICLLGLIGCDPAMYGINRDYVLNNTVKIELVSYENTSPEFIRLDGQNTPVFDFSKTALIATLDESRFEDIVTDIANNRFLYYNRALNEPIGKTLILYQNDGSMIVLYGCVYEDEKGRTYYFGECSIFDENGMFIEYLGDTDNDYVDMLEAKYF